MVQWDQGAIRGIRAREAFPQVINEGSWHARNSGTDRGGVCRPADEDQMSRRGPETLGAAAILDDRVIALRPGDQVPPQRTGRRPAVRGGRCQDKVARRAGRDRLRHGGNRQCGHDG